MTGFVQIRSSAQVLSVSGTTFKLNAGPEDLATLTRPYVGAVPAELVPRLLKRPYECEVIGPVEAPAEVPPHTAVAVTQDGGAEGVAQAPKALPVVAPATLYPHPFKVGAVILQDGKEYRVVGLKGSEVITEPIAAPVAA